MAVFNALDWPIRLLIAALIAGGIGTGAFFVARTSGDSDQPEVIAATPTVAAKTSTALMTSEPTEEPTQPPSRPTAVAPNPTADPRTPIRDLPSAEQIQLGSDGQYFIADRGDGCRWEEGYRQTYDATGLEVSLFTDCLADFFYDFRPETAEVFLVQE